MNIRTKEFDQELKFISKIEGIDATAAAVKSVKEYSKRLYWETVKKQVEDNPIERDDKDFLGDVNLHIKD